MARAVFDGVVHAASSTTSRCFWKGKANHWPVVVLSVAGIIAAVDQFTKAFALLILSDGPQTFGPFRFVIVRNPGGPFGIATGASLFWTLITLSIVLAAIAGVIGGSRYLPAPSGAAIALGAVIGGGIGNLVDRLVRESGVGRGAVIDWIEIDFYSRVFNLADVALRAGGLVLVVVLLTQPTRGSTAAGSATCQSGFPSRRRSTIRDDS